MTPHTVSTEPAAISCSNCRACCCRLEVMLIDDADVPVRFTTESEWGGWVMHRLDDGWCAALDRQTMRCRIYLQRPGICRDFATGDDDCLSERARCLPVAAPGQAISLDLQPCSGS